MLKKLSNAEKANLYKAVADLENNYGLQRVELAMKELVENLDGKRQRVQHEQIELLPFEPVPERKREYKGRRPNGENQRRLKRYFEINKDSYYDTRNENEMVARLYYFHSKNQYEIADLIGINQRAVSQALKKISEKQKRELFQRWENE